MDRLAAELLRIADELSGSVLNKTGQKRFARLQKLVDKFNALREEAIGITGGDDSIFYDTSSTIDLGPSYIGEATLKVESAQDSSDGVDGKVVLSYEYDDSIGWRKKRTMSENFEFVRGGDFMDELLKDELRDMIRYVNKAIKWFREYNPDMTEEKSDKLLEDGE